MAPRGRITFIRRKSGTVEVWTPGAKGYASLIIGGSREFSKSCLRVFQTSSDHGELPIIVNRMQSA
jgi:hypothetical protein